MKKLIPMTEYVLQKAASGMDSNKLASMIVSYAAFLKQPLQLSMFMHELINKCDCKHMCGYCKELEIAREDKIIFKGECGIMDGWCLQFPDGTLFGSTKGLKNYTIEYLVYNDLELTDEIANQFEL